MKQIWTLFISGLFLVITIGVFLPNTQAETDRGPPKTIEDASISGLKTEVPRSADLESAIVAKEKELKEKELLLKEAEERLAVEDARLKIRIAELEKLQLEIQSTQQANKQVSEDIFKRMVKTFETMNPKKAASIIATMSDDLAVEMLLKMKEKKLAGVLDVMDAPRATGLSSLMALRRPAGKSIGENNPNKKGGEK